MIYVSAPVRGYARGPRFICTGTQTTHGELQACHDLQQKPDFIRSSVYDNHWASMKIATQPDHISHCNTIPVKIGRIEGPASIYDKYSPGLDSDSGGIVGEESDTHPAKSAAGGS